MNEPAGPRVFLTNAKVASDIVQTFAKYYNAETNTTYWLISEKPRMKFKIWLDFNSVPISVRHGLRQVNAIGHKAPDPARLENIQAWFYRGAEKLGERACRAFREWNYKGHTVHQKEVDFRVPKPSKAHGSLGMTSWGIDFAADIGCIAVFLVNGELVEMSTDRELNKRDPPGQTMNGEMIPPRPISWDCFSPLAGEAGRPRAFVFKNVDKDTLDAVLQMTPAQVADVMKPVAVPTPSRTAKTRHDNASHANQDGKNGPARSVRASVNYTEACDEFDDDRSARARKSKPRKRKLGKAATTKACPTPSERCPGENRDDEEVLPQAGPSSKKMKQDTEEEAATKDEATPPASDAQSITNSAVATNTSQSTPYPTPQPPAQARDVPELPSRNNEEEAVVGAQSHREQLQAATTSQIASQALPSFQALTPFQIQDLTERYEVAKLRLEMMEIARQFRAAGLEPPSA